MSARPGLHPDLGRERRLPNRRVSLLLLAVLAGCGAAQDCSPAARLAELAAERAAFRRTIWPLGHVGGCPSTVPEVLIPEENRVGEYRRALVERIRASELRGDLEQVEREGQLAAERVNEHDCVGVRWKSEPHVSEARRGLAAEMARLREMDAALRRLSAQVAECRH